MQVHFASKKRKPWLFIVFSQFYNSKNFLADLGKARGCSTITYVTDLLIHLLPQSSFVKISLHYALTVEDDAFSHKIDNVTIFEDYKSRRASELPYWFKIYGKFVEWVDFDSCQYWWSFSGGGSAINSATPSSFQLP